MIRPQDPRIDQIVEEYAMRNDWSLFSNKTWGANLTPQKKWIVMNEKSSSTLPRSLPLPKWYEREMPASHWHVRPPQHRPPTAGAKLPDVELTNGISVSFSFYIRKNYTCSPIKFLDILLKTQKPHIGNHWYIQLASLSASFSPAPWSPPHGPCWSVGFFSLTGKQSERSILSAIP